MEQSRPEPGSLWQRALDFIFLPVRIALSHDTVAKLGLTSILQERLNICAAHTTGFALDIGAGDGNPFIAHYRNGYGCDILPQKNVDVVADASALPFKDSSFDTVLFIGSYIYLPDQVVGLKEACRALRPGGKVLITHINPFFYWLRHKTAWWDKEENVSYPRHEQLWHGIILSHIHDAGLRFEKNVPYLAHLCSLYVARKP